MSALSRATVAIHSLFARGCAVSWRPASAPLGFLPSWISSRPARRLSPVGFSFARDSRALTGGASGGSYFYLLLCVYYSYLELTVTCELERRGGGQRCDVCDVRSHSGHTSLTILGEMSERESTRSPRARARDGPVGPSARAPARSPVRDMSTHRHVRDTAVHTTQCSCTVESSETRPASEVRHVRLMIGLRLARACAVTVQ